MKRNLIVFSLLIILLFNTNKSSAWGNKGHALVAEVAFNYLDTKTKQNVMKYLNGMTIEEASNWMDNIKSDKKYDYLKPYHYVNFDKGSKVDEPSDDNIIKALNTILKELDNENAYSNEEIKIKILYLFHLIGDLHQPLHVGYGDDKGGNTVQVSFFGRGSNLHKMWDSDIIEYKGTTLGDILKTNHFSPDEISNLKKIDIISWAKDSRNVLGNVYKINTKIDDIYINSNYPIIESQILKGGIRLASILEHYFKDAEYIPSTTIGEKVQEPILIDVNKVADYEGKLVRVCSKVYGTKFMESAKKQPTFLNVGADYPNSPLTILIWGDNRGNFKNKPEEFYNGKNICVTGKVEIYKGKPEIIISQEKEIEIR